MVAKNRIISLGSVEYQTLIALSRRFEVSLTWLGLRALSNPAKKYSRTEARLPVPVTFAREHRRGSEQ